MSARLQQALEKWQDEVNEETVKLLNQGYSPKLAQTLAETRVQSRRRARYLAVKDAAHQIAEIARGVPIRND